MRHRIAGRRLSRDSEHRLAMRRNMVSSLFEHGRVSTTIEKAKEVRGFAEKLITLAKKGDLASRRRAISLLGNRNIVEYEDGKAVKKGTVINRLFSDIGPQYLDRQGGYTRIVKLAKRRLGDNGQVVLLQLVGQSDKTSSKKRKNKNKRDRRAELFAEMSGTASSTEETVEKPASEDKNTEAVEEAQPSKAEKADNADENQAADDKVQGEEENK